MGKAFSIFMGVVLLMAIGFAGAMMQEDTEKMSEKIYYESRGAEGYIPRHWMGEVGKGI